MKLHEETMPKHQEDYVAGRSAGHARAAVNAKASLEYIKQHPGICADDLQAALGGKTNIPMLVKHKLIVLRRKVINEKQITYYFPAGTQPPNNK